MKKCISNFRFYQVIIVEIKRSNIPFHVCIVVLMTRNIKNRTYEIFTKVKLSSIISRRFEKSDPNNLD